MVTQWQQDEQSFRARQLLEILVDLICFSETNEPGIIVIIFDSKS
jgi:hypothetical protein